MRKVVFYPSNSLMPKNTAFPFFQETKRPSKEMQVTIARQLGLDPSTVSNFFMNARRRSVDKWREDDIVVSNPGAMLLSPQHSSHSPLSSPLSTPPPPQPSTTPRSNQRTVLLTTGSGSGTIVQQLAQSNDPVNSFTSLSSDL